MSTHIIRRVVTLILVFALSASFCVTAFAAKETNTAGLKFSATLSSGEVESGDQPQTVILTVMANKKFATDGIGLFVDAGDLKIVSIANEQFQVNGNVWNASEDSGIVTSATYDAENIMVDMIAEVTIQIPANCISGTYAIGIKGIEITKDYGTLVEDGVEAYATLVITNKTSSDESVPPVDPEPQPPVDPEPEPPVEPEDPSHDNCPSAKFTDVNQDMWYHEGIDYVIDNGLMNGVGDTLFSPNGTTNRAMIVTILYRLEGTPGGEDASFTDVADGQWYSDAVGWAAANGIVTGYENGTFGPLKAITREQLAAILYRYASYKDCDVSASASLQGFGDAGTVSSYAVPSVEWAVGAELINGMDGNLKPKGTATRAQVATILMRFCENVAN